MNENQYFETVKSFKFLANKSLGQNFLTNPDIASKIVEKLDVKKGDKVLEIGAGLGSLSYFLSEKAAKTQLIDIDERMLQFLNDQFQNNENIEVKRQNVLKHDLSGFTKIIGNLPYYITSGIIEKILVDAKDAEIIVLMTQKEVYPKLLSNFKSPLSLFLNYVSEISPAMDVNRNNFTPVPHVDSVVFMLKPNQNIKDNNTPIKYVGGYAEWTFPLSIYANNHPVTIMDTFNYDNIWINQEDLKKSGVLILDRDIDGAIFYTFKSCPYLTEMGYPREDIKPKDIITKDSMRNAIITTIFFFGTLIGVILIMIWAVLF